MQVEKSKACSCSSLRLPLTKWYRVLSRRIVLRALVETKSKKLSITVKLIKVESEIISLNHSGFCTFRQCLLKEIVHPGFSAPAALLYVATPVSSQPSRLSTSFPSWNVFIKDWGRVSSSVTLSSNQKTTPGRGLELFRREPAKRCVTGHSSFPSIVSSTF